MIQNLPPRTARERLAEVRVVDVREPHEFALGHVAGAELVPLATVPAAATAWNRDEPVLVICRSGGRSGRAAEVLARMGFTNVLNLAGGMLAWEADRLPVQREA